MANPPDRAKDDSSVGAKNGQLSSKCCTSRKQLSNTDTYWQKATDKKTVKYWHKLTKSDCKILTQTDKNQLFNTDTNWQKVTVKYRHTLTKSNCQILTQTDKKQLSNTDNCNCQTLTETDAKQSNITESNEECIECVDKINNKQPARPPYIELSLPRIKLHRDGQIYLR